MEVIKFEQEAPETAADVLLEMMNHADGYEGVIVLLVGGDDPLFRFSGNMTMAEAAFQMFAAMVGLSIMDKD
jgi:glycerate-2-kinase